MSVSVLMPLLLHNRYLHLGLITSHWVSKFGLTCGKHPVWCSDSETKDKRTRLTPAETNRRTFSATFLLKSSKQSETGVKLLKTH